MCYVKIADPLAAIVNSIEMEYGGGGFMHMKFCLASLFDP